MRELKLIEWHLTPRGWEKTEGGAPPDRVLTMRCEESPATLKCQEIWSKGANETIRPLIEKYGHGPQSLN